MSRKRKHSCRGDTESESFRDYVLKKFRENGLSPEAVFERAQMTEEEITELFGYRPETKGRD